MADPTIPAGHPVRAARRPGRCERTPERKAHRNGHRDRGGETRVGEIHLRIPKVRDGTYFPSLLEPPDGARRPCWQ